MKIVITLLIMAALLPLCSLAIDANQLHYVEILPVQSAAATGSAVDVSAYKGNATFLVAHGAESSATNYLQTVTLQHAAASSYSTITNLAASAGVSTLSGTNAAKVVEFACDLGRLHKNVRAVVTQANATNAVGVILVAPMKSQ